MIRKQSQMKWQGTKWRIIDDASVCHKDTFGALEQIHTTCPAAAASLSAAFAKALGHPLRGKSLLKGSTRDMRSAYKQLGVDPDQLRFCTVAVWDPYNDEWKFAISYALPFGMAGAVLEFNRISAFIVASAAGGLPYPCRLSTMTLGS